MINMNALQRFSFTYMLCTNKNKIKTPSLILHEIF